MNYQDMLIRRLQKAEQDRVRDLAFFHNKEKQFNAPGHINVEKYIEFLADINSQHVRIKDLRYPSGRKDTCIAITAHNSGPRWEELNLYWICNDGNEHHHNLAHTAGCRGGTLEIKSVYLQALEIFGTYRHKDIHNPNGEGRLTQESSFNYQIPNLRICPENT